jgi:predicted NUDIX family NTP pyrophosphohydrolase
MAALKKTSRRSMLSAGILAYRKGARGLEVLLVHPGGPFWRKKDNGAWSIPKGEIDATDPPEKVALREFAEELGPSASIGLLQALGEVRQRGGKRVIAFAGEGDFDPATLSSNAFDI